jgi:hypothetical protein
VSGVTENVGHCRVIKCRVKETRPISVKKPHGPTELWPNSRADFPVLQNPTQCAKESKTATQNIIFPGKKMTEKVTRQNSTKQQGRNHSSHFFVIELQINNKHCL